MSGEIKIWNGRGPWKAVNPGLLRDLRPSIGCTPPISSPSLDRLRGGLYFDLDPLLQTGDECRCLVDKTFGEFVLSFSIPIRTEVIGGLTAQTERVSPRGRMGWVDLGWSEEVEGSSVWNSILVEALKFFLGLVLEKNLII